MIFLKTGIQTQFRNGIFTLTSTAKPAHSAAILVINAKSFSFCSWLLGEISCSDASVPFIRCGRVSHTTTNRLPGKENTMKWWSVKAFVEIFLQAGKGLVMVQPGQLLVNGFCIHVHIAMTSEALCQNMAKLRPNFRPKRTSTHLCFRFIQVRLWTKEPGGHSFTTRTSLRVLHECHCHINKPALFTSPKNPPQINGVHFLLKAFQWSRAQVHQSLKLQWSSWFHQIYWVPGKFDDTLDRSRKRWSITTNLSNQ